jgi:hypothetical protein
VAKGHRWVNGILDDVVEARAALEEKMITPSYILVTSKQYEELVRLTRKYQAEGYEKAEKWGMGAMLMGVQLIVVDDDTVINMVSGSEKNG